MQVNCEIIKDLLPLYHDDVCSQESKKLVEEHLKICPKCQEELQQMDYELKVGSSIEEANALKNIAQKWKKDKVSAFLLGVLILSIVASIGSAIAYNAIGSYVAPDGMLVEPFALIPLSLLFGLIAIVSAITLSIMFLIKSSRGRKSTR